MAMDMEQGQRKDIDVTLNDRITLDIDGEIISTSPYIVDLENYDGNNWFTQSNKFVKLGIAESDSILFTHQAMPSMGLKDVTGMVVEFDYEVSNVSSNYPIVSSISFTDSYQTNYFFTENILTTQGHIEIDCSLFEFESNVVNNAISNQGFGIGIEFDGVKSNATVKLWNVKLHLYFENRLSPQEDAIVNRLTPNIDLYKNGSSLTLELKNSESDNVKYEVKLCDLIYPVGSIYMSVNSANPSLLFGGEWEQLKDKFLLASGDTYQNGATGGSATVSLTKSQMPRHTHTQNSHNHTQNAHSHEYGNKVPSIGDVDWQYTSARKMSYTSGSYYYPFSNKNTGGIGEDSATNNKTATNNEATATNQYTGGTNTTQAEQNGSAHNNMPPYLAVYVWKRTG